MITRVKQLTRMNVWALETCGLGSTRGATYVEFECSPRDALAQVQKVMAARGVDATYRSLMAVRRKLQKATEVSDRALAAGESALTRYVTVTGATQE